MKKKQENKAQTINPSIPSISFISQNESQPGQTKITFSRSKTPFFRKKNNYSSEEENISSNALNKSINNQTFIYNSINFNNQGLFNNINNSNNNNNTISNNSKKRKGGGVNNYMVNTGILNFFETMKKSRSISKQKNSKYMNIINKLNNAPFGNKSLNKHKSKSFAKQKNNNSIKNDKKKTSNIINISHINTSSPYLNNTNNFSRKNKRKLLTNYVNRNINMLSVLNNNNKINNLITTNNNTNNNTNNSKIKKVKKKPDINNNNNNKSNSYNINKINNNHLPETESDRNDTNIQTSSEESNTLSEEDKNILSQIESLIFQLLNNGSSPKKLIFREIENIYKNSYLLFNSNNSINVSNENHKISKKNSNSNLNLNLSKKNIKDSESKKTVSMNNKDKNKIIIENELDILNRKYNQIKEENINLKYLITEKTTAFEDVKNSLKNFQNEINQLKNNNQNNLKNKNNDKSIDNNEIIFVNSKGLEMKNIKLNLSNVQKVNEIQDLSSLKNRQKDTNNNSINCNNLSFGQNNSFEIHFENSNSNSKNNILNSNNISIDPLSLTFHDQMSNVEEIQQNDLGKDLNKNYECSPSLRKATEILIQTGIMPNKDEKK